MLFEKKPFLSLCIQMVLLSPKPALAKWLPAATVFTSSIHFFSHPLALILHKFLLLSFFTYFVFSPRRVICRYEGRVYTMFPLLPEDSDQGEQLHLLFWVHNDWHNWSKWRWWNILLHYSFYYYHIKSKKVFTGL